MNPEYIKVTSRIPQEQLEKAAAWEQERPVDVQSRNFGVEIQNQNNSYARLIPAIEGLVGKGDLGDFVVLAPEKQQSIMGVSRKILVTHPSFPKDTFVIGGIGPVTFDDNRIHIDHPDPRHTLHTRLHLPQGVMATGYIRADGKSDPVPNSEPFGGYWLTSAVSKYEKTTQALLMMPKPHTVCTPVVSAALTGITSEKKLGVFVYRLPKIHQNLAELFSFDQNYWHPDVLLPITNNKPISEVVHILSYGQLSFSVYQAMGLLEQMHTQKEWVHRQYHMGNIYRGFNFATNSQDPFFIITDWDTSENISHFGKTPARKYHKPIAPYDEVRWHEIENALNMLSNFDGPDQHLPLWKMSLGIVGIMGYQHIPYANRDIIFDTYEEMVDNYQFVYRSDFEEDVSETPPKTMLPRVQEITKNVMTRRLINAGYFRSLRP